MKITSEKRYISGLGLPHPYTGVFRAISIPSVVKFFGHKYCIRVNVDGETSDFNGIRPAHIIFFLERTNYTLVGLCARKLVIERKSL